MEDIIREFWLCSLESDFSKFDWDLAFDSYDPYLAENCIGHAQGTLEEFIDLYDNIYGLNSMECDVPSWSTYETDWGSFNDVDVVRAILTAKYNYLHELFESNIHGDNAELLTRVRNRRKLSESELISLFDECIHAQHATGDILEDIDVEELRAEVEKQWKEDNEKFPTNIREFLTY